MNTLAAAATACALLTTVGCVSQQTYDKAKAEANDVTRALDMARIDVRELEQRVDVLQAMNKKEDAATAEIRAAIQREVEAAPLMRQRADDKLAALQTQVAHLLNQSRQLGRDIADAKQEGTSLQATVAQLKRDLDESRLTSLSMPPLPPAQPMPSPSPALTSADPVPAPVASAQPSPAPANPPVKSTGITRPAKGDPAQTDDSWTGMIKNWVSSLWGWIFG